MTEALRFVMPTLPIPHRYLVQFQPRRTPHYFTDVLVIGGGLAGLRAALEIPHSLEVLVVTKDKMQESNSQYAQGGIASVLDPEDRFENHIEDTLRAGAGLCDPDVVEAVVREAPAQLDELVRWGTDFDRDGDRLALTLEGGHSHRRIVHALGDATGQEVMRAVIARARSAPHVQLWEDTFTLDLLTSPLGYLPAPGRGLGEGCVGAIVHRPGQGVLLVWAKQTILASGGAGCLYRETTNPPVATGDGMAAAYRAGAALRDMEFMQFHPTVLYVAGSARYLISEAARGEGGRLIDKNGERFMPAIDARAELAPRDIVARAIARQMEKTRHPCVYLDLSHIPAEQIHRRFPAIERVCRSFDIDITQDQIPVRPGAHYMIGGVSVDLDGRTSLPGLWAAGEVTSSGLHGANRLASNSLLEGLVFGARCGRGAAERAAAMPDTLSARPTVSGFSPERGTLDLADLKNSLQSLLWRKAGIVRDGDGLEEALGDVEYWCRYVLAHEFGDRAGWELQNMLTVARLMLWGAMEREESRGVHYRSDFPGTEDLHWRRHLTVPAAEVA
jgi:L-aspartate oxidase